MKEKHKPIYILVNIIALGLALVFVEYSGVMSTGLSVAQLLVLLLIFAAIHFLKFARIYLLLLEEMLPVGQVLKTYIKSQFVSTLLPFKTGELFKMFFYASQTNRPAKGVIAVLLERYFDTIALCVILIPCYFMANSTSTMPLAVILLGFLITLTVIYLAFDSSYKYLNRFFVTRGGGKKSLTALRVLSKARDFYDESKETMRGRGVFVILLSFLAWMAEIALIFVMGRMLGVEVGFGTIPTYIADGFFGVENSLFMTYVNICVMFSLVFLLVAYLLKFFRLIMKGVKS